MKSFKMVAAAATLGGLAACGSADPTAPQLGDAGLEAVDGMAQSVGTASEHDPTPITCFKFAPPAQEGEEPRKIVVVEFQQGECPPPFLPFGAE